MTLPWYGRGKSLLGAIWRAVAPSRRQFARQETIDDASIYDFEATGFVSTSGEIYASMPCTLTVVADDTVTWTLRRNIGFGWVGLAVRRLELSAVAEGTEIELYAQGSEGL